jgi:mixed-linked glucan synthase
MAAAVTRRVGLHVEATNGGADDESRRNSSAADHSPVAKRINDAAANAKRNDVWVAAQEGEMPAAAGNSSQPPLLFRTMKVKGSILHPYRLFWPSSARLSSPSPS